jgi:hypothetical protein
LICCARLAALAGSMRWAASICCDVYCTLHFLDPHDAQRWRSATMPAVTMPPCSARCSHVGPRCRRPGSRRRGQPVGW